MDKEQRRLVWILTIICAVAGGVLALLNGVTEPKISKQTEETVKHALHEVLPVATRFHEDFAMLEEARIGGEEITDFFLGYDQNETLTGMVMIMESRGYSSNIKLMVGISIEGLVSGVKILSQSETPGLGNKIVEDSFLLQPALQNASVQQELAVTKDGGDVQAVTGATVSSRAVVRGINKALNTARLIRIKP